MEKSGTIVKCENGTVTVKINRDSACGENCAACGMCSGKELEVTVKTDEYFEVGTLVTLVSEDKAVLKLSALGYLSLTALLILGAILGAIFKSELLSFVFAFLFLFVGILILRKISPKECDLEIKR